MTVKSPASAADCKTIPMRSRHWRAAWPCVWGSKPKIEIWPASRLLNPSRISTVVVLPAPFGPSRAKISPAGIDKSTPRTACTWP